MNVIIKIQKEFQSKVRQWVINCFGEKIADDTIERNHRFLEESLELVQSTGCSREDAHALVDYVFDRPVGEVYQEIGGVMVTLSALCSANKQPLFVNAMIELNMINQPEIIERIRIKQSKKPMASPLPIDITANGCN
ncbi:MAG: hypothetical protein P4L31_07515 [Candidatus Babeliales bacterium]|nr:hypothetical protein [Candidatus Babeliales bacterium]